MGSEPRRILRLALLERLYALYAFVITISA